MDRYLSMIIDTEKISYDYRRRVERLMGFRDDDIKLMKTVNKLMKQHGNRVSMVAREMGMNRMAVYRLYMRLGLETPSADPVPTIDIKVCPYCGSEKWERVRRLYHCLDSKCGLEFRGPRAYRRYVFMAIEEA